MTVTDCVISGTNFYTGVIGNNAVYAVARAVATNSSYASPDLYPGQQNNYTCRRIAYRADTSPIPDGDVVTSKKLRMVTDINGAIGDFFKLYVNYYNWAGLDPTVMADWLTIYNGLLAQALGGLMFDTSGVAPSTEYFSAELAGMVVNKTGFTYFGLISELDKLNTPPVSVNEIVEVCSPDHGTPANAPFLRVVHHTPGSLSEGVDVKMTGGMQDYTGGIRD